MSRFTQQIKYYSIGIPSHSWTHLLLLINDFRKNEQAEMRLFLPPEFTGQRDTLTLTGPAVIKRVEQNRQGVAVKFLKELKAFKPSL